MSVTLPGTMGAGRRRRGGSSTSSVPTGTGCVGVDAGEHLGERLGQPHAATLEADEHEARRAPWLRSTISWAMRVIARRTSSALRTCVRIMALARHGVPFTYGPHRTHFTFGRNGSRGGGGVRPRPRRRRPTGARRRGAAPDRHVRTRPRGGDTASTVMPAAARFVPQLQLGLDVERARQVVEHDQLGRVHECACRGHPLALPARQPQAARADQRGGAVGHLVDVGADRGELERSAAAGRPASRRA